MAVRGSNYWWLKWWNLTWSVYRNIIVNAFAYEIGIEGADQQILWCTGDDSTLFYQGVWTMQKFYERFQGEPLTDDGRHDVNIDFDVLLNLGKQRR